MEKPSEIIKLTDKVIKDSVPITNDREILQWLCDSSCVDYKENKKTLMSDLRLELKNTLGRQNGTLLFEFRTWAWIVSYEGLKYNIFSAPKKGTAIELCDTSYEDVRLGKHTAQIKKFLEKLSETVERPREK